MKIRISSVLFLSLFLSAGFSSADEYMRTPASVRSISMGGVKCAIFNEISAFFYNPALVGHISDERSKYFFGNYMSNWGLNNSFVNNFTEIGRYNSYYFPQWPTLSQEEKDRFLSITPLFGEGMIDYALGFHSGSFSFGMGGYSSGDAELYVTPSEIPGFPPVLNAYIVNDYNARACASFDTGPMSIGIAVNDIKRGKVNIDTDFSNAVDFLYRLFTNGLSTSTVFTSGECVSVDAGISYVNDNLSAGFVMRNIAPQQVNWSSGTASSFMTEMDVGLFYKIQEGVFVGADLSDLTSNADLTSKMHFGAEYAAGLMSLRVGYNQGGLTYGFKFSILEYAYAQKFGMPGSPITDNWQYLGINITTVF